MSHIKTYESDAIDVQYDVKRCIHAAECVSRLRAVFDSQKRPWIQLANAPADSIAETIHHCPSGALHYSRKDDKAGEPTPETNTIWLQANGPLYVRGQVTLVKGDETTVIMDETRVALCRCGASRNKPFCDNSHKDIHFEASATLTDASQTEPDITDIPGGVLQIIFHTNGPIQVKGSFAILDAAAEPLKRVAEEEWFCRCGGSQNKPFCDGTHNHNGFSAE